MDKKIRFTVLGLIFILSTLFFWSALNSALQPSKAQSAPNMRVFFLDRTMECNKNGLCLAYLYGSSDAGVKVAGVQGAMTFSPNIEPIGLIQDEKCSNDSFKLDKQINFRKTKLPSGEDVVEFAYGTSKRDEELVEGNHCIAAVIVQPKNITTVPDAAKLALADSALWKAGGPTTITVNADVTPVAITINDTAPIPSITPPPPGGGGTNPPTGSCTRRAEGDCSCDDSVDLVDWDMLRSSLNGEGGSCDVNGDGTPNAVDLSIWLQKNDLLRIGSTELPSPSPDPTGSVTGAPTPTSGSNSTTPTMSPVPTGITGTNPTATPTPISSTNDVPTPTP